MPKFIVNRSLIFFLAMSFGLALYAQDAEDAAALPKNSFTWTQEQLELGFRFYEVVFNGHEVPRGEEVKELQQGASDSRL